MLFRSRRAATLHGYRPGDRLVLVHQHHEPWHDRGTPAPEATVLAYLLWVFTEGHDPGQGPPHPAALTYRARYPRGFHVGDVIGVDDRYHSYHGTGWTAHPELTRHLDGQRLTPHRRVGVAARVTLLLSALWPLALGVDSVYDHLVGWVVSVLVACGILLHESVVDDRPGR